MNKPDKQTGACLLLKPAWALGLGIKADKKRRLYTHHKPQSIKADITRHDCLLGKAPIHAGFGIKADKKTGSVCFLQVTKYIEDREGGVYVFVNGSKPIAMRVSQADRSVFFCPLLSALFNLLNF